MVAILPLKKRQRCQKKSGSAPDVLQITIEARPQEGRAWRINDSRFPAKIGIRINVRGNLDRDYSKRGSNVKSIRFLAGIPSGTAKKKPRYNTWPVILNSLPQEPQRFFRVSRLPSCCPHRQLPAEFLGKQRPIGTRCEKGDAYVAIEPVIPHAKRHDLFNFQIIMRDGSSCHLTIMDHPIRRFPKKIDCADVAIAKYQLGNRQIPSVRIFRKIKVSLDTHRAIDLLQQIADLPISNLDHRTFHLASYWCYLLALLYNSKSPFCRGHSPFIFSSGFL